MTRDATTAEINQLINKILVTKAQKKFIFQRKWQPTPVFLPGKVHRQGGLADCSPWDYMTEHA